MQHVDRPAEVQAFAIPPWRGRVRMNGDPPRHVPGPNLCLRVFRRPRWRRRVGLRPAVGRAELQLAIGASLDLKAFFMDGAMVSATQQDEIRQRRGPTLSPVLDVMSLAEWEIAAGEAA